MADGWVDDGANARRVYAAFADRYAALAPTKPHNGLYERPASLGLLGDVNGLRVLDAGCGPGICSEILARGGASVSGFDVTPEMVALARDRCAGLDAEFRVGDFSGPLDWLGDGSFDRVLCSLALDYVRDLAPVFREFARVTRPGGVLVFSMGHPMGDWLFEEARGDRPYHETRHFGMQWSGFGDPEPFVESYRRPLADILNGLVDAGWTFERIVEPLPLPEMKDVAPRLYDALVLAPAFLCVRARR